MPVSAYFGGHGTEVKKNMEKEYGPEKGERVFYATANKRGEKPGSDGVVSAAKTGASVGAQVAEGRLADHDAMELKRCIDRAYDAYKAGEVDGEYISAAQGIAEEHYAAHKPDQWLATDSDVLALRDLLR